MKEQHNGVLSQTIELTISTIHLVEIFYTSVTASAVSSGDGLVSLFLELSPDSPVEFSESVD
eukprot:CAMPEP_0202466918 /NCGR_PEP_ID=MMETSP1360-20130828/70308_1 /ASSEMBLY_ACC=CAM_ASM_000848 /TAXON_ID=515479 /ORGANISM="Licmophora paradoxa, Strain CCMP2313" /LENGTH=61 /DNA_ID=CAMNT_0049091225 /DNA_START=41 /DNA_END=226 /DNA_ORIENTATION=+